MLFLRAKGAFYYWINHFFIVRVKFDFMKSLDAIIILPLPFYPLPPPPPQSSNNPIPHCWKASLWGFCWMMFSVWRSLQYAWPSSVKLSSLLSPTSLVLHLLFFHLLFLLCWGSPLSWCICMPAINNWAFHSCRIWMQRRTTKGCKESGGKRIEISRGEKAKEKGWCWRVAGSFYSVSVGCAVYSLISSARKVWRGGENRGKTCSLWLKKKTQSAQWCWLWIIVCVDASV